MSKLRFNNISAELKNIIDYLGDINEDICDESYEEIIDEIETIENDEDLYDLCVICITIGKPEVLDTILNYIVLNKNQIDYLNDLIDNHFNKYNIKKITKEFKDIINNYKKKKLGKRKNKN